MNEHKKKRKRRRHEEESVRITYHGEKRVRERLGIPKSAVKKNIEKAQKYGVTSKETYGPFKRYLEWLYLDYGKANNIKSYNHFIYVFDNNVLITLLHIPTKYIDAAEASQRRKYNLMTEGESFYAKNRK